MEIGTAGTGAAPGEKNKKRSTSGGRGNSGGRKDNGGENPDFFGETAEFPANKSRILMWFLLLVVLMTFGGLAGAYVVVSTNGVLEWKPFNLPFQVWISTAIILASSFTYSLAHKAIDSGNHQKTKTWLMATTVLGAMFVSSQLLLWLELVRRGVYMRGNPYAGFFYMITVLHAVHVIGGIIALGYILLHAWDEAGWEREQKRRREISSAVGWYWHFMGGLWIVLLLLLGFWK